MTKNTNTIVISGGKVIDPANKRNGEFDVLIENGKISAVDKPGAFKSKAGATVIDATGKIVTPGLIDIHVHLREPGLEWKETIATGTAAAVAGGFTTVCCMPNTNPAIDTTATVKFIYEQAERANLARVYPIGAITMGREGKLLAPMAELRDAGCVAFSDDGYPVDSTGLMRRACEYSLMLDTVLSVHEEVRSMTKGCSMNEGALSLKMGLIGFPAAAEEIMISRDIELSLLTGARVHFQHVSTGRGVELIRRGKADGANITAETAPHYVTLTEDAVAEYNTLAKVSMPLRTEADRAAVLAGLAEGVIDCIATDHAPHEADSKNVEFEKASWGFLGLQTSLPLMLAQVRNGKIKLERVIAAMTCDAARCMKLSGGTLSVGADADVTLIDLDRSAVLMPEMIRSKSKNTPFMNWKLQGLATHTIVGGRLVYEIEGKK